MENLIQKHKAFVASQIEKSFNGNIQSDEADIEKAHKDGDMHPNGKWVWVQAANGGRGDWRVAGARTHKNASAGSSDSTVGSKEQKFKDSFKNASDEVLQKVVDGKIQASAEEKKWAKDIINERKAAGVKGDAAKKIIDLLKVHSSKYSDISKVVAWKTDKGNYYIDYDGADTGIVLNGNRINDKDFEDAGVKVVKTNDDSTSKQKSDPRDKVAQDAGFKDYAEMKGWQDYVTAKNLLKKPSMQAKTKEAVRKELEKKVADYEKEHADVIEKVKDKRKKDRESIPDGWKKGTSGSFVKKEGNASVIVNKDGGSYSVNLHYNGYSGGSGDVKSGLTLDEAIKLGNKFMKDPRGYFDEGGKKAVDSYASMDIKDAKKALVGKVVTLADYWPDGRGGSQDAIGEIKNVRLYGNNKTPIAEVVYPNGDEQMIRLDEIDDGKMKDSYKTPITIGDDKTKLDAIKNKISNKSDKKKADLPFTGLTKHSQVIDYAKTIDGADFEEIDSEFDDKGSKAFRLNYSGGLKLDVDFPNNGEYLYTFRDKNGNSLYEVRSTRETDGTDWSVMLNPRKWGNLVKSNISKHISQRKAEQTRYYNLYSRGSKSSYYDKYLNAKYDIERLKRNLDKVDKVLQLS